MDDLLRDVTRIGRWECVQVKGGACYGTYFYKLHDGRNRLSCVLFIIPGICTVQYCPVHRRISFEPIIIIDTLAHLAELTFTTYLPDRSLEL